MYLEISVLANVFQNSLAYAYQYPIAQEEHLEQFQVVVRIPFHYLEQQLRSFLLSMHLLSSQ